MPAPPSGNVTFLFTDIEGSTALWERHPTEMRELLAEHDQIARSVIEAHGGYVFTTAGDSFSVAFARTVDALDAAIALQRRLVGMSSDLEIRVRAGIHTGQTTERDGDYFGPAVNRCARIAAAGHGGQILMSGTSGALIERDLPERVDLVDLGVHRLRDLLEPERILQVCHPDLERDFPKIRTIEGPGDTLPTQLTSFIGREHELADIVVLLADHRLVTLTGPGGAGKTRLSLEVAQRLIHEHPDGIRLVELAALVDHDVFLDEVAQRFGAVGAGGVPTARTIAEKIDDRRMLLVLDNCEHLVEAVARLTSDLLAACPNLRVIATSRERLAIGGEVVYRVPSLSVPPEGIDVDRSLDYDSIRLFVERAQLSDPDFELSATNVDDVASICRHLDGIPLAIELAAARVRSMSPQQIDSRLDERFRLLKGVDRSSDDRHQTLLSTIEWSHDLLKKPEQVVFRRLGAFVSDFSLEAAEQVGAEGEIFEFDVVELLTALVDKSMIATTAGNDGTRYQLLESIRVYASGLLERAGESAAAIERHAIHYADLAADLQRRQRGGKLASALATFDDEEDNFRASLRFAIDSGEAVLAARLVDGLGYLWYAGGVRREGLEWCEALFALAADLPDDVRAGALHSYALMLGGTGDLGLGVEVLREQVVIRRRLGDPLRLAAALNNLGNLLYDIGDSRAAEIVLEEAIEIQREGGDTASLMLSTLATGKMHAGDPAAEGLFHEALAEARTFDHLYGIAVAMGGYGQFLVQAGRPEDCRPYLVEARERFDELYVTPGLADLDMNLGLMHRAEGDRIAAARTLLQSLATPGERWYDESQVWVVQYAASVIDDPPMATMLIGAASSDYDRRAAPQPVYVQADLEDTRRRLGEQLDEEEFSRCLRAGARRTRQEVIEMATTALESYISASEAST